MVDIVRFNVRVCDRDEIVCLNEGQIQKLEQGECLVFDYDCGDNVTIQGNTNGIFTLDGMPIKLYQSI